MACLSFQKCSYSEAVNREGYVHIPLLPANPLISNRITLQGLVTLALIKQSIEQTLLEKS